MIGEDTLGGAGDTRTRTEHWLMFRAKNGKSHRWMAFSDRQTALDAIGDADATVHATQWGVKVVEVTQTVVADTEWLGDDRDDAYEAELDDREAMLTAWEIIDWGTQ